MTIMIIIMIIIIVYAMSFYTIRQLLGADCRLPKQPGLELALRLRLLPQRLQALGKDGLDLLGSGGLGSHCP